MKDHRANQELQVQYRCTMSREELLVDVARGHILRESCSTCRERAVNIASEGDGEELSNVYI